MSAGICMAEFTGGPWDGRSERWVMPAPESVRLDGVLYELAGFNYGPKDEAERYARYAAIV